MKNIILHTDSNGFPDRTITIDLGQFMFGIGIHRNQRCGNINCGFFTIHFACFCFLWSWQEKTLKRN